MTRFRRELTSLTLVAAAVLVAGACVKPGSPDVAISKIEAQLVFGVPEEAAPAITPVTPVAQAIVDAPPAPAEPVTLFKPFAGPRISLPAVRTGRPACPTADPSAAAKRIAGSFLENEATAGVYRWNLKYKGPNAAGELIDASVMTSRMIRGYKEIRPGVFQFEMIQPYTNDSVYISTYEVITNATAVDPTPPVQGLVKSPVIVGPPERGLILREERVENARGERQPGGFQPRSGVLLLPFPVTPGEHYQSVGVDARGQTLVHDATVRNVVRVDACGEVVDGWLVDATRTVGSSGGGGSYAYSYVIAPQYGAMPIMEKYTFSEGGAPPGVAPTAEGVPAGALTEVQYTIGQLEPKPLEGSP